jgi:hypothetical protein
MFDKLKENYLRNHNLYQHYTDGVYGGLYLGFSKEWMYLELPPASTSEGFRCSLLDTDNGDVYTTLEYVAYDDEVCYLDSDYNNTYLYCLNNYVYGCHFCACNRKGIAKTQGAKTDDECDGDRFLIQSITPLNSELILLSETYTIEELEKRLLNEK